MPITISQTVWIEVAHRFSGHPILENQRVHGHSLKVTVTATRDAPALPSEPTLIGGMVMDFCAFSQQVQIISDMLDHRFLNDVKELGPPTLENIAEFLGTRMAVVAPLRTLSVRVERPSLGQAAEWTP